MLKAFVFRAAALGSILVLAACSDVTTPRTENVGYSLIESKPSNVVLQNERFVSELSFADPCSGEPITGTGTSHVLVSATTTRSGNTILNSNERFHFAGIGTVTGTQYTGSAVNNYSATLTSGSAIVSTSYTSLQVISQGRADNFSLIIKSHVTFNANGVPTATHEVVRTDCK